MPEQSITVIGLSVISFIFGILGGFLSKNTAVILKDISLKIRMDGMEAQFDGLKGQMDIKYNGLARTVKNQLGDITSEAPGTAEVPSEYEVPEILQGFAQSVGVNIEKVLKGNPEEIEKMTKVLEKNVGKSPNGNFPKPL